MDNILADHMDSMTSETEAEIMWPPPNPTFPPAEEPSPMTAYDQIEKLTLL
jgi:hypothetical protein